ncbi:CpaF family protein [Pseudidiomarina sp. 1APP75-32.1]|uniref:CpaF family protein n=2 Tax=Pseudidiomarina terrestris TaxID=2820060 RepID=A0AAW7R1Y2_9GAMM|nr:CpaF family protein [Pseudidiomarina sp. 1APP75-32.1]MDN7136567.1 CpaF family protein [Pseudidiomarina sp. 1ASP75-5]MDN7138919.1 CpaF family protein [Pseudidiomarina sp. 1ASP75-14]MEA3589148.1 CpaF family protein [Pseudidiomarina sp. 1APP75-27a]
MGLGPLSALIADEGISEIMVNHYNSIFIERQGKLLPTDIRFRSEEELLQVIERIVLPLGRRIDSAQPMVDARLPDGSRVNAVIAPLALRGACLTIRKFARKTIDFDDLTRLNAITDSAKAYLQEMVRIRKNILIVGGTGTGKTTLLNLLASEVPENQRIITIEDAAELKLRHVNLIALEARPANAEGRGQVTIRELLINALRMRPDRIVVGECRGAEALDMLQAMNTGHEGSLSTLHANSPREALQRLEVMVMLAGFELPLTAVRQQIASAIQVIVQIARLSDGRRVITAISEVVGLESIAYQITPLFEWRDSQLCCTGMGSEWGQHNGH